MTRAELRRAVERETRPNDILDFHLYKLFGVPRMTQHIDHALAAMPDVHYNLDVGHAGATVHLRTNGHRYGRGATPALAVCSALLS